MKKFLILLFFCGIIIGAAIGLYSYHHNRTVAGSSDILTNIKLDDAKEMIQNIAEAEYKKRRFQAVIAVYESALKAAPDNEEIKAKLAESYYQLALIEKELGNKSSSEEYLIKSQELLK